ncbi:hypothetical protein GQ54DRAFT_302901 [Martensiomyces pterosporus]|nr:hypothetical protein GQ54DRAFT_302901 [Martensiomyces pterosporus]
MSHAVSTLPELSTALSVIESVDSHPSRCESPLLPMGQGAWYQVDPDRLSNQLGRVPNRYSQQSIANKNYSIRDDDDEEVDELVSAGAMHSKKKVLVGHKGAKYGMRKPKMPRPKSYRGDTSPSAASTVGGVQQSPVRDLSSKLKSACRKLNPKRLAKAGNHHHQPAAAVAAPSTLSKGDGAVHPAPLKSAAAL